jgi:small GTP-binding protein
MEEINLESLKAEILPKDQTKFDLSFKMIILGDPGVGKSCLTTQAIKSTFDEAYNTTVGFEYISFNVKLNDKAIKLQIWDTCGQEIYRSLISSFYRNATLAVLVYAINSKESFINLDAWLKDIKLQSNPDIKIFLVGNKTDLEEQRVVNFEEAKKYATENDFDYVNETSAKTGFNAKEVFIQAAKVLYSEHLKYKNKANLSSNKYNLNTNAKIDKGNAPQRKKDGCC